MREILVMTTRMSNNVEWIQKGEKGWGFADAKTIVFVGKDCEYSYEYPNEERLKDLSLIIIRGDGQIDVVSAILALLEQMKDNELWFLFHPGGGDKFKDPVTKNKLQERIDRSGRKEKWEQFQKNVIRACAYSLGGGGRQAALLKTLLQLFEKRKEKSF